MSLLDLLIFIPVLGAVAIALGAPVRTTALGAAALNAAVTGAVWFLFDSAKAGAYQLTASRPILDSPELSFAVGIDGMSLIMVVLTAIVTLCAVYVSPRTAPSQGSNRLYYASSLLIAAGALGAFVSTDLFFFYAFHELALIPTFLMIGIFGSGDRRAAAWKITIYLGAGSIVLLGGLVALYLNLSGGNLTFDMVQLRENAAAGDVPALTQQWIFLALVIGFGILVSLFPFHSWAAPAYASAPTPTAMLHAGVLKKFGLYGLLRVALPLLPEGLEASWVLNTLLVLLLGNILFVGFVTLAQKRLDTMVANSSVMHMGYVFLGIASASALGTQGAILLMFAHGISVALLFALCDKIEEKTGTQEFSKLGGLAKRTPFLAIVFGFAAFASIGLPGFANFASEVLVFFGGFSHFSPDDGLGALEIATILALWGVVISAVYMLRAYRSVFWGSPGSHSGASGDIMESRRWPYVTMVAALLVIGFYPKLFLNLVGGEPSPPTTAATSNPIFDVRP